MSFRDSLPRNQFGHIIRLVAVVLLLALVACARPSPAPPSPPPTAQPAPKAAPLSPELEAGRSLFLSKGCANCHGANLEFLIVVNMPEISEGAIMQQVRKPTGMMRSFTEAELSDGELQKIARFMVAALSREGQHRP